MADTDHVTLIKKGPAARSPGGEPYQVFQNQHRQQHSLVQFIHALDSEGRCQESHCHL